MPSPSHLTPKTRPANPLIDKHYVMADMGWSESTLWRRVRDGQYPRPLKSGPGRTSGNRWLLSTHERVKAQLIDAAGDHDDAA
jgi:predicted DNA-binding transcriptional regulator AlpA